MNPLARRERRRNALAKVRSSFKPEPLEPRLCLGAPLALTTDGPVWADPTADELLEPAPATAEAGPSADSTAGGIAPDLIAIDAATSTSCCSSATIFVSVETLQGTVSEADPATPGKFRFHASAPCGGAAPPSSVTVQFTLGGTATKNTDYNGALTSGSVSISLSGNSTTGWSGFKDVAFSAIDDNMFEVAETVDVVIKSSSIYVIGTGAAQGIVADNDARIITVESELITVGDAEDVTVTVVDQDGVPVSGQTLDVVAYDGAYVRPRQTSVTTGSDGTATVEIEGIAPGVSNVTLATPDDQRGTGAQNVDNPRLEEPTVSKDSLFVGQTGEFKVRLLKADGSPWAGKGGVVAESSDKTSIEIVSSGVQTDGQGYAKFTYRAKKANANVTLKATFKPSADAQPIASNTVAVAAKAVKLVLSPDPANSIQIKQGETKALTVKAVDAANPNTTVAGVSLLLESSNLDAVRFVNPAGGSTTGLSGSTNDQGVFDFSIVGANTAGVSSVSATAGTDAGGSWTVYRQ